MNEQVLELLRSIAGSLVSIAASLQRVEVVEKDNTDAPRAETQEEHLQRRADYNRANALALYPELVVEGYPNNRATWYDSDNDEVVFTPYGYRKLKEVQHELADPHAD